MYVRRPCFGGIVKIYTEGIIQNALPQGNSNVETFNATGYAGQIIISLNQNRRHCESIRQPGLAPIVGSVIAGNQIFDLMVFNFRNINGM
jgi:hypothetical protein